MAEALIWSLILTLVFELGYALLWGIKKVDIPLIVAMNVLTNPLVVLWNRHFAEAGYLIATVIPELAAVTVEAMLLCRFGKAVKRPVLLGICINVFSYFAGVLIQLFL